MQESTHRGHAIVERVVADLKNSAPARIARSARTLRLRLPRDWTWQPLTGRFNITGITGEHSLQPRRSTPRLESNPEGFERDGGPGRWFGLIGPLLYGCPEGDIRRPLHLLEGSTVELLSQQFGEAVKRVTVSDKKRERVIDAHKEVREVLEADLTLRAWGINPYLIGSYGRRTSRFPAKDVDIFLRFDNRTTAASPDVVYEQVKTVLANTYGLADNDPDGRVTEQARSLKIAYSDPLLPGGTDEFSVDAVPAVQWGDHWGIPNRSRDQWASGEARWIKTNPIKFGEFTDGLATSTETPVIDGRNAYRPVVRLVRQVRHVHLGALKPSGLHAEIATYDTWSAGEVSSVAWALAFAQTLSAVAQRFRAASDQPLLDPALETPLKPELDPSAWNVAANVFSLLADKAQEALEADVCRAAFLWREILGENENGPVFPLPAGCDANGLPIRKVTAVASVGSNEPRGFA